MSRTKVLDRNDVPESIFGTLVSFRKSDDGVRYLHATEMSTKFSSSRGTFDWYEYFHEQPRDL